MLLGFLLSGFVPSAPAQSALYELVIRNARVIDPESRLDAVRNLGIENGRIQAVSEAALEGRAYLEGESLVAAPGFIDLHQHAHTPFDYWLKARDGVTLAAELEVGTADVTSWYAARAGKSPIHFAVSVGHIPCRMAVAGDAPSFLPDADSAGASAPLDATKMKQLKALLERGLREGATAVGLGLQYTPGANQMETLEVFKVAAAYQAPCHVHLRFKGDKGIQNVFGAVLEVLACNSVTGARAHVCHVQSTANQHTARVLDLLDQAHARGIDVSVECYPYTAGMTDIKSPIFNPGWQETTGISYGDLQWAATGERLTRESFERYRRTGGMVILHSNSEATIETALAHPLTMVASDGIRGHPRNAGTCARVLGRYVREKGLLSLSQAVEKLSLQPAKHLETRVPALKNKGRIRPGADADLVLFDPVAITDQATYEEPNLPSKGILHVLVGGTLIIKDGTPLEGALPGSAVRAPTP